MGLEDAPWPEDVISALQALGPGHGFSVPEVLFAKIDDARRGELEARFAGQAFEAEEAVARALAIAEGATMVRVGSALFGARARR